MHNLDRLRPQDLRSTPLSNGSSGSIIRIASDGNCLFKAISERCKYLGTNVPDFSKDHVELRKEVVEELRNPANRPSIAMILSSEREVEVNIITDANIDLYIKKMATLKTWGGELEITTIASLLKIRILIHHNGQIIKIPHGTGYDAWSEHIELVHESVNAGLNIGFSAEVESANHYNLLVGDVLAKAILNDNNLSTDYYKNLQAVLPVLIDNVLANFSFGKDVYLKIAAEIKRIILEFKDEILEEERELAEAIDEEYDDLDIEFEFRGVDFEYTSKIDRGGLKSIPPNDEQFQEFINKKALEKHSDFESLLKKEQESIKKALVEEYFDDFELAYEQAAIPVVAENFNVPQHSLSFDFQQYWIDIVAENINRDVIGAVDVRRVMDAVSYLADFVDTDHPIGEFFDEIIEFLKSDKMLLVQNNAAILKKQIESNIRLEIEALNVATRLRTTDKLDVHRVFAATSDAIGSYLAHLLKYMIEHDRFASASDQHGHHLGLALKKADNYYKTYVEGHLIESLSYSSKTPSKVTSLRIDGILLALREIGREVAGKFFDIGKVEPIKEVLATLSSKKRKTDGKKIEEKKLELETKTQVLSNIRNGAISEDIPNFFVPTFVFTVGIQKNGKTLERKFIPLSFKASTIISASDTPGHTMLPHSRDVNKRFFKLIGERSKSYTFHEVGNSKCLDFERHADDSDMVFTYKLKDEGFIREIVDNLSRVLDSFGTDKKCKIYAVNLLAYSSLAICNHCTRAIIVALNDRREGSFLDILTKEINRDGRNLFAYAQGDSKAGGGIRIGIRTSAVILVDGHYHDQERLVSNCPAVVIEKGSQVDVKHFGNNTFVELVKPNLSAIPSNSMGAAIITASKKFDTFTAVQQARLRNQFSTMEIN